MEKDLANRIYDLLSPWERVETSVEEIEESLKTEPLITIKFLLDRFTEV